MADAPDTAASQAAPSGGSKIVPILLVVNSLLVAAVLAVFFLRGGGSGGSAGGHGEAAPAAKGDAHGAPGEGAPGPTQKLADFVVHLRDAESDRYARLSFEIEVASEEQRTRLALFTPRIRDAFISYLSDRTLEEMRGSEAISRTKEALEKKLPELAPGVKVKALYITDLVIQ
jgi:flagellar FliL protein